ncbi:patatin-like phospholipase family protein [Shouchella lonarensis]|uniref:NTE family protein n=1 Tax=Shouchella lonarensis TaxID=1464122 RepID=A0A1G6GND0_9BACI|nr:patatin-like phospholipase family protein [Shouchella lonarensis]SDB83245.1 NTE family protein [Shouchella lonarensis]
MDVDAVFAGGGVRAFAFIGALEVTEQKGLKFHRIAGTSAGAIVAALVMAGYRSDELLETLSTLDVKTLQDERFPYLPFPFVKWLNLYFRLGLYKGDRLEQWLQDCLEKKGVRSFEDLPQGALKIVVSDVTRGRIVVLPDDLKDYGIIPEKYSVARAVRMSCSIPYFFEPVKLHHKTVDRGVSYIVDGGLLSNFPMWIFHDRKKTPRRPVVGFQLSPQLEEEPPHQIYNAFDMYKAVFDTMMSAHDKRYISKEHAKNIVFIPVDTVKVTDFSVTDVEKEAMIAVGHEKTAAFLENWPSS